MMWALTWMSILSGLRAARALSELARGALHEGLRALRQVARQWVAALTQPTHLSVCGRQRQRSRKQNAMSELSRSSARC